MCKIVAHKYLTNLKKNFVMGTFDLIRYLYKSCLQQKS